MKPFLELATGDEKAEELLARFDREKNIWNIGFGGDFWDAVEAARADGLLGEGRRIAVIDSMPDTSLAPLADLTVYALGDDRPHVHGTLVSLLIRLVAPAATIEHYAVCRGGTPDLDHIAGALKRIFDDPPDYVCLSLGAAQPMEAGEETELRCRLAEGDFIGAARHLRDHPRAPPMVRDCRFEQCLCRLIAERMGDSGESTAPMIDRKPVIVSAAGNANALFCPARAPDSLSVGFNSEHYWIENGDEKRSWEQPSYAQSSFLDYSLIEPEGFIGSSFAAPLITGALALRKDPRSVRALLKPNNIAAMALPWEREVETWNRAGLPTPLPVVRQLISIYDMAWSCVGDVGRSNLSPSELLEARLFFANTVNNKGVVLLDCREFLALARAVELWRWCLEVRPWARSPRANLASAFLSLGDGGAKIGMNEKERATKLLQARAIFLELLKDDPANQAWQAGLRDAHRLIEAMAAEAGVADPPAEGG